MFLGELVFNLLLFIDMSIDYMDLKELLLLLQQANKLKIMKFTVFCLFALVAIACVAARPEEKKYTSKFDNIDVDKILQSDRLLTNYYKCLMDTGRCTADGTELKKTLPDALETECKKCSDKQREGIKKVIKFLVNNKPEMWESLANKYDPEKIYRVKFEKEAREIGVTV